MSVSLTVLWRSDLKPENILCGDEKDDSSVMIADFGLSKFASPAEIMNMPCGTLAYVGETHHVLLCFLSRAHSLFLCYFSAPEVLKLQGYSKAVDVWSLGIIMFLL